MKFSWLIEEKVFEGSETIRWRARIKPRILDLLSGTEWSFNGITISFRGGQAFKGDGSKGDESIDVLCGPTGNLEKKDNDILIINVLNKMTSQNMNESEREVFNIIMQTIYCSPEKPEGDDFTGRVSVLNKQIKDILTNHSEELSKVENRDKLMFIFVPEETVSLIKLNKNTSGTLESQLIRPLYEKLNDLKTEDTKDTIKINLFDNKGDCYCFWSRG